MTTMTVEVKPITRAIAIAAATISAFGIIATLGRAAGLTRPYYILRVLNLDFETTLPTWFTSMLLFLAAMMVSAVTVTNQTGRFRW
ncbi:MAG: hypothetical protein ACRD7E_21740, partial [Bryobacteraceae bacterium]